MGEGILLTRNYGAVKVRLKELMDNREINRNQLSKLIGTRFEVADKWYQGDLEKLDLDILSRICFVLNCQPGDLLEYENPSAETENPA